MAKKTFEQKFNLASRLLVDYQELMGDDNYQIYFDGNDWGIVEDGNFNLIGEDIDEVIDYLESKVDQEEEEGDVRAY